MNVFDICANMRALKYVYEMCPDIGYRAVLVARPFAPKVFRCAHSHLMDARRVDVHAIIARLFFYSIHSLS